MFKSKLLFMFFILIIFIGYTSCGKDNSIGPHPPEQKATKLSDDTYVIEESDSFYYASKQDSTFIFNYTGNVPDMTVGKIIAGKIIDNDSLKGAYLRRVTSIDTLPGQLRIKTEPASLAEAVEYGEIDTTFQLTISQMNMLKSGKYELAKMQMVHAVEGAKVTDYGIALSGVNLFSGSVDGIDLDVTITDGEIAFQPIFSFGGKIEWFRLTEFHTEVGGDLTFNCTVKATASNRLEYTSEKTIASFRHYAYQQIGPLPVVEEITLRFIAGFELDTYADLMVQSGFESNYNLKFGARYNKDWSPCWQKVWEHGGNFEPVPVTWNQSTGVIVKVYIKPQVSVKLYTMAGPYLAAKPYLEFNGDIETSPKSWSWELYAGADGILGFEVSILDYSLADFNADLVDWREVIASASSTESPIVMISSPYDGAAFSEGEEINFVGEAHDPQDGTLSGLSLVWTSDKDGQISTGTSFSKNDLSINTHVITLTATDSEGNTSTDIITINVNSNQDYNLITVPATSGYPMGWEGVSQPVHTVSLDAFQIGKYEVTYALWLEVKTWAEAHGYTFSNPGEPGGCLEPPCSTTAQHPVTYINWMDCIAWCNAYSEKEGLTPVYYTTSLKTTPYRNSSIGINDDCVDWYADGFRLPKEAEWEYAARYIDGTNVSPGDQHSGYNLHPDIKDCAWHINNSDGYTHSVGQLQPNSLGAYDMSGNVWEWCWEWEFVDEGLNPYNGRIIRGGGWCSDILGCLSANSVSLDPTLAHGTVGFRICRTELPR